MEKNNFLTPLDVNDISPTLIRTYAFNLEKKEWVKRKFRSRTVESYELELIVESDGYMNLEGKRYLLKPGDLCFRKPGEVTMGELPYSCYMISFSMNKDDVTQSIQPSYQNAIIDQLPPVLSTRNPKYYMLIFSKILEQYIANEVSSSLLIRSLILEMIYAAYQEVKRYYLPSSAYMSVIKKAISFMETNYTDKLSLELISHHVNLSSSHFQKIFKETMYVSPNDYLINYRLTKAKELLLVTDDSITDITYNCGFESNAYFSYVFKKKMMMTPTHYRKSHQKP